MKTLIALLCCAALAVAAEPKKKLIEFGWDEPDTAFMRAHIAEMEKTPFRGTVFDVNKDFLGAAWGSKAFTEKDLAADIANLKATPFKKFTDNFLRFDVTPGDVDWFGDFSAAIANAKLAAKVAREGKARGILFDIEQYNKPLWNYSKQKNAKTKSWDQYVAQAHRHGADVMRAFQGGFPGGTIFMTFAYTLPGEQSDRKKEKLPQAEYGLLVPFLDGMVEAAAKNVHIVDGYEIAYAFKQKQEFDLGYKRMREEVLPLVENREKYLQVLSCGFGIWMDQDWRKKGWDETDFSKNHFTPEQFEKSVKFALDRADDYVWIYTEKPKWWGPNGPEKLPQAYVDALRRAAEEK